MTNLKKIKTLSAHTLYLVGLSLFTYGSLEAQGESPDREVGVVGLSASDPLEVTEKVELPAPEPSSDESLSEDSVYQGFHPWQRFADEANQEITVGRRIHLPELDHIEVIKAELDHLVNEANRIFKDNPQGLRRAIRRGLAVSVNGQVTIVSHKEQLNEDAVANLEKSVNPKFDRIELTMIDQAGVGERNGGKVIIAKFAPGEMGSRRSQEINRMRVLMLDLPLDANRDENGNFIVVDRTNPELLILTDKMCLNTRTNVLWLDGSFENGKFFARPRPGVPHALNRYINGTFYGPPRGERRDHAIIAGIDSLAQAALVVAIPFIYQVIDLKILPDENAKNGILATVVFCTSLVFNYVSEAQQNFANRNKTVLIEVPKRILMTFPISFANLVLSGHTDPHSISQLLWIEVQSKLLSSALSFIPNAGGEAGLKFLKGTTRIPLLGIEVSRRFVVRQLISTWPRTLLVIFLFKDKDRFHNILFESIPVVLAADFVFSWWYAGARLRLAAFQKFLDFTGLDFVRSFFDIPRLRDINLRSKMNPKMRKEYVKLLEHYNPWRIFKGGILGAKDLAVLGYKEFRGREHDDFFSDWKARVDSTKRRLWHFGATNSCVNFITSFAQNF